MKKPKKPSHTSAGNSGNGFPMAKSKIGSKAGGKAPVSKIKAPARKKKKPAAKK